MQSFGDNVKAGIAVNKRFAEARVKKTHSLKAQISQGEIPWRDLGGCKSLVAPAGGLNRTYLLRHLLALRLWRRFLALRYASAASRLLAPIWTITPRHVAAEALSLHLFAADSPAARNSAKLTIVNLLADRSIPTISPLPRRVLMLTPSLAAGGAERQLVLCANGLSARGWDVMVAAKHLTRPLGCDALVPELSGLPVLQIEACRTGSLSSPLLMALPPDFRELLIRLYHLVCLHRPSVVHAWMDEMGAAGGLAAALAGVPKIILSARNLAPHRFLLPQLSVIHAAMNVLIDHRAAVLINNSQAGANDYASWLGRPLGNISVLRNGFPDLPDGDQSQWRKRLGIGKDAPVVGGMFRLAFEKRPKLWLQTASRLSARHPAMQFIIFGNGEMRQDVADLARRLGLRDRLHLPGFTAGRADALASLDVFLLTSLYEGTPNVALECQWLGIPFVATDAGGLKEALARPQPIPADPIALADAVESSLGKSREPKRDWIVRNFGLERMLDETERLYQLAEGDISRAGTAPKDAL